MNTNRSLFVGVVIAVVIVGVVVIAYRAQLHSQETPVVSQPDTTATSTGTNSQTATSSVGGVTMTGPGSIQIVNNTAGGTSVKTPSLTRPMTFAASVSADLKAQLTAEENTVIPQLQKAPTREDLWLKLGMYRKEAGDYVGAQEAWGYVAATAPSVLRTAAYANMADMYMNFAHDNVRAEANFKAAIALAPTYVQYYHDLYNLYHYTLKDNTKAAAILAQGLKAVPNSTELLAVQKQFQAGQ